MEDRFIVSGFYSLLTNGFIDNSHCHHPYVRNHEGVIGRNHIKDTQFTTSGYRFESAYFRAHGIEPLVTKCTADYKDTADYIFYTPRSIDTLETLVLPYVSDTALRPNHVKCMPMPNAQFPSSHFPVGARLVLRS